MKPSGLMWRASRGVSFHSRFDIDSITRAVIGLAEEIEDGNVILVEAFYQTIQPTEGRSSLFGLTFNDSIYLYVYR